MDLTQARRLVLAFSETLLSVPVERHSEQSRVTELSDGGRSGCAKASRRGAGKLFRVSSRAACRTLG